MGCPLKSWAPWGSRGTLVLGAVLWGWAGAQAQAEGVPQALGRRQSCAWLGRQG